MKRNFEIEFSSEAIDFMESLDDKSREKIYYNAKRAEEIRKEYFKQKTEKNEK